MTTWVGTSWKMNKSVADAREYAAGLIDGIAGKDLAGIQPFIIPPFTALSPVHDIVSADPRILLGAQNAHWEDAGAWTGEISVPQVADVGARLIEIGHSERRQHFGETLETTRLKVAATLRHKLTALLCIGEPAEVQADGKSEEFILHQARGALNGLSTDELASVVIAYEPIWAIGAEGRPATPEELQPPFQALKVEYGTNVLALLYGGSVNVENAPELLATDGIDGLFIGRTALELPGLLALLGIATEHRTPNTVDQPTEQ